MAEAASRGRNRSTWDPSDVQHRGDTLGTGAVPSVEHHQCQESHAAVKRDVLLAGEALAGCVGALRPGRLALGFRFCELQALPAGAEPARGRLSCLFKVLFSVSPCGA